MCPDTCSEASDLLIRLGPALQTLTHAAEQVLACAKGSSDSVSFAHVTRHRHHFAKGGMLPGVWSNIAGEGERHGEPAPPEPTSPSLNPCVFGASCWSCTQPHGQTMSSQSHGRQPPLPTPAMQPAPLRLKPGPHRHHLDPSCWWRQAAPAHIPKIHHQFNKFKKDWSLRRDHKP